MELKRRDNVLKDEIDRKAEYKYRELLAHIRQFRESKGITLAALAMDTQTYPSYLHRVETGSISTSVPKLISILDAMGLKLEVVEQEKPVQ